MRRLNVAMVALALLLTLYVGRLVDLQGLQWQHFRALGNQERMVTLTIPAPRGTITSSDGAILAMTVQTDQVSADPPQIPASQQAAVARQLAGPLRMTQASILTKLEHPTSPQYVELKAAVTASVASKVGSLNLPGIGLTPSYTRVYPNGDLASGLLGFTDVRSGVLTGVAGLEQQYNSLLTGRPGTEVVEDAGNGVPVPGTAIKTRPMVPASGLRLTIRSSIEWAAERDCAAEVRKTHARNCTVVVMQPSTGKVLALAQYPGFNPADVTNLAATTDIPVEDVFAPGSTAKVMTAAAAFQHGQTPRTAFTVPDRITWHGFHFHDAEPHPVQHLTIAGIIAYSSNDGMVQVAQRISPQVQYRELRAFGLGSYSGLGLPGESAGLLPKPSQWYPNERYLLSFGQGVGVTAIQMASVYATIANGGVRVTPTVVAGTTTGAGKFVPAPAPSSHRVIPASVAADLMRILTQVPVADAKAGEPWGVVPGYTIAGKTGTSQEQNKTYGSSFIGIAPASDPQLVVAVNVQDPQHVNFGIQVAGPVFNKVMSFALQTMHIPPDGNHVPYVPLTAP